jgi:hypothetical protein
MEIQQSGRQLSLVIGNGGAPPLRGRIASSGVVAAAQNGAGRVRGLSAEVDRRTSPETMVGAIQLGECPRAGTDPPPDIPFHARRDTSSRAKAGP